jgi:hypothetical protein
MTALGLGSRLGAQGFFRQLWQALWQHSVLSASCQAQSAYAIRHGSWHPMDRAPGASGITRLMPNYALERSVKVWRVGAARGAPLACGEILRSRRAARASRGPLNADVRSSRAGRAGLTVYGPAV